MKKFLLGLALITALTLLGLVWVDGDVFSQDNTTDPTEDPAVNIPFIDQDGDGINDLLQNGWGLRFMKRYKKRTAIWNVINGEGMRSGRMIDTDGDGELDTPFREYVQNKMNELFDEDGDGVADSDIKSLLDTDGDGKPDMKPGDLLIDTDRDGEPDTPLMDILLDSDGDGIADITFGRPHQGRLIDLDGDGTAETELRDYFQLRFNELFDEDGDGIADTDFRSLMDTDGDGRPDMNPNELMIDTDNDGTPDTPLMDMLLDSDGDGIPDISLGDHMRRRFQSFDQDGDGLPDDMSIEDIRKSMKEMHQWHNEMMDRMGRGMPPFVDENGDGIPDNLPWQFERRHP